jgi:hypothetical protein
MSLSKDSVEKNAADVELDKEAANLARFNQLIANRQHAANLENFNKLMKKRSPVAGMNVVVKSSSSKQASSSSSSSKVPSRGTLPPTPFQVADPSRSRETEDADELYRRNCETATEQTRAMLEGMFKGDKSNSETV